MVEAPIVAAASVPLTGNRSVTAHAATGEQAPIRLNLLRGFELRQQGLQIELPFSAQRLLAFLALHDRPLQRLYIAGSLWFDTTQDHANANLRTALWRLRRPGCAAVKATSTDLSLADDVVVDLVETSAAAHRALGHEHASSDLEQLCAAGDLLPGWYDDWLLIERERFRQLRVHALETLCGDCTDAGDFAAAAAAGLAAVAAEPLRESAHRVLIHAHLAEGNVTEAIRQYTIYGDLVRTQLRIEPRRLRDLVRDIDLGPMREALLRVDDPSP